MIGCGLRNSENQKSIKESGTSSHEEVILEDTIIHNQIFKFSKRSTFDEAENISRTGKYINNIAFGNHLFYKDNELSIIRKYILLPPDKVDFIKTKIDSIFNEFCIDSTYLNETIYLDTNFNTIYSKSSTVTINFERKKVKRGDTLRVIMEFFEPQIDIQYLEMYFDIPEDTSMVRIVETPGNSYKYIHNPQNTGINYLTGIVLINGFSKTALPYDTIIASRIIYINEEYNVE